MPVLFKRQIVKYRIALDSGAIIALSRSSVSAFALLNDLAPLAFFIIPAPALAEVLRGGARDAAVHRVLNTFRTDIVPTTAGAAQRAGEVLGSAKASARFTLDALIGATSLDHNARTIVTADPDDYGYLFGADLQVIKCN